MFELNMEDDISSAVFGLLMMSSPSSQKNPKQENNNKHHIFRKDLNFEMEYTSLDSDIASKMNNKVYYEMQVFDKENIPAQRSSQEMLEICNDCGKRFNDRQAYRSHVKAHSRQRLYQCPFCEQSFVYRSRCKRHETRHYTLDDDDNNS